MSLLRLLELLALEGPRLVLSIRAVLELLEDWVIFEAGKLSCVLVTEAAEPTPSRSLLSG